VNGKIVFDNGILSRMEGYRLVRSRPVPNGYAGGRRSPRKGGAVEFSDYREYTAGDEPRRVDWKAYARLGRMYVKEFLDERQDSILFLIDASASMNWGSGDEHKGNYTLQLAASMGTSVLAGNDRLAVMVGSKSRLPFVGVNADINNGTKKDDIKTPDNDMHFLPSMAGRNSLPRLWNWLTEATFGGGTDLVGCLRAGLTVMPGASSLYVFSDLMDPAGVEEMLRLAVGSGLTVTLIHVLAPGELEPPGDGEWTMLDAETGERVEVSLTPGALRDYLRRLDDFNRALDQSCRRWEARRLLINTGWPLAETLLRVLPRHGVLRPC